MADLDDEWAYYNTETSECEIGDECFVTTACVNHIGAGDDCFELRTLRTYRDNVLARSTDGMNDIARYYAEAPMLVDRLQSYPNAADELSRAYLLYIVPCVVLARLRLHGWVHKLYRYGMNDLARRLG